MSTDQLELRKGPTLNPVSFTESDAGLVLHMQRNGIKESVSIIPGAPTIITIGTWATQDESVREKIATDPKKPVNVVSVHSWAIAESITKPEAMRKILGLELDAPLAIYLSDAMPGEGTQRNVIDQNLREALEKSGLHGRYAIIGETTYGSDPANFGDETRRFATMQRPNGRSITAADLIEKYFTTDYPSDRGLAEMEFSSTIEPGITANQGFNGFAPTGNY